MKKVININFQGRVIPIEESAYEDLQKYTDSLRRYFAREEGRDEIINDIENRIAELFSERLKKDATGCITDADLNEIIKGIGRPEEFDDAEEMGGTNATGNTTGTTAGTQQQAWSASAASEPRGSWYRNQNDKVLGGVCSGLAHYLKVDPTIVRILFALITLGGFGSGILLYIIFWIVLPARPMEFNVRRRLYRNPDEKVIGGVCSGLSSYFNTPVWVPRLIFVAPFLLSIFGNIFGNIFHWGDFDHFPNIVFGSFGGTLVTAYIILWVVIPFASTASEKLEMRGEKVDLESIKNTVQEEMKDLKVRAGKMGNEFKEKASVLGEEMKDRGQAFRAEAAPVVRSTGAGIGHAIGVLFKAFFLFIAGVIIFALFVALMAIIFSGVGVFPLKNFLLQGFWQHAFAWGTLFLFLAVPLIGLMIWLVRRITGVRSKNNYLPYTFGTLWVLGWICFIGLGTLISREFRRTGSVREDIALTQPSNGRMQVVVDEQVGRFYSITWFNDDDSHLPALTAEEDSMQLNTIRVKIGRSKDSQYHMYTVHLARGASPLEAEQTAGKINFPVRQADSILYLPKGFTFAKESKFRNQQVVVVLEVPQGKMIRMDHEVDNYSWFNINGNTRGIRINMDYDEWDGGRYDWRTDMWYRMTDKGLEKLEKDENDWNGNDNNKRNSDEKDYRYRRGDSVDIHINKNDTSVNIKLKASTLKVTEADNGSNGESDNNNTEEEPSAKKSASKLHGMISVLDLLKIDD
jgi:phage shock protein PspC (stress-responsive transcriptional regulator)